MKKLYSFLFLMIAFITSNFAQNTCSTPYQYASSTSYTYTALTGTPNPDTTNAYGCLATNSNVLWLYLQICNSGNMDITLATSGGSAMDIDFVTWGPLTAPTDCGLSVGQIEDCSYSTGLEVVNITGAITGQFYKIMISNYSNQPGTITVSSSGGIAIACDSITLGACFTGSIPTQNICQVTTNPILNQNSIIWEKDTTYTGPYYIQKETTTMGVYSTIATVMNNDTSAYVDSISNPMIQAFRYRIATTDTCGYGIIAYGASHQTIHLLTSISSSTGYPQLAWNNYIGFGYGTYYIYRGASPATLTLYDSISASFNSYTDVAAIPGLNFYSVSVNPTSPCQPSRSMTMGSFSNVSPVMFTGINEYEFNQLTVGPNPAYDVLNFTLGNVSADITIDIIDVTGRIVLSKSFQNVNQDAVSLNDISSGSYVVRFISENKTTHRNIIIY